MLVLHSTWGKYSCLEFYYRLVLQYYWLLFCYTEIISFRNTCVLLAFTESKAEFIYCCPLQLGPWGLLKISPWPKAIKAWLPARWSFWKPTGRVICSISVLSVVNTVSLSLLTSDETRYISNNLYHSCHGCSDDNLRQGLAWQDESRLRPSCSAHIHVTHCVALSWRAISWPQKVSFIWKITFLLRHCFFFT